MILLILLLSGCTEKINGIEIHNYTDEDTEKIEEVLASDNRLRNALVVYHEDDLLAGVTIGTFSRFRKEKIEKELKEKLQTEYPDANILLTADSKVVLETQKIAKLTEDKELSKKIKKLKSLAEEET